MSLIARAALLLLVTVLGSLALPAGALGGPASQVLPARRPIVTTRGHEYVSRGSLVLRYDLLRPAGEHRSPAVVLLHGGGWWSGTRQDLSRSRNIAQAFAERGIAAMVIDYRLACGTSTHPRRVEGQSFTTGARLCHGGRVHLADQVADVHAAVEHLRAHASRLHVDRRRVALLGVSAGGHLALNAALSGEGSERVSAGINWSGLPSVVFIAEDAYASDVLNLRASFTNAAGCDFSTCPDRWREYSPLHIVTSSTRRFAVLNVAGATEPQVPLMRMSQFNTHLRRLGWRSELLVGRRDCHGSGCAFYRPRGRQLPVLHESIGFLASAWGMGGGEAVG